MKTFEEAFDTVVPNILEEDATPEKIAELWKGQIDREARFAGLGNEIHNHKGLRKVMGHLLDKICGDVEPNTNVAMATMYAVRLGVEIGMEMERQDLKL